jgi:hypothetical protein
MLAKLSAIVRQVPGCAGYRKGQRARGTSPVAAWLKCDPSNLKATISPDNNSIIWGSNMYPAQGTVRPVLSFSDSIEQLCYVNRLQGNFSRSSGAWGRITETQKGHVRPQLSPRYMRRDVCFMSCTAETILLPDNTENSTWHCLSFSSANRWCFFPAMFGSRHHPSEHA